MKPKTSIRTCILLFPMLVLAQTKVQLRDVQFEVPKKFKVIQKINGSLDYDAFYENGNILTDTARADYYPRISYQYYENPGQGSERSEVVLQRLNDYMAEGLQQDTLIINAGKDYSLAMYTLGENSLFEIKSLGEKGWINIAYLDSPENDAANLGAVNHIM